MASLGYSTSALANSSSDASSSSSSTIASLAPLQLLAAWAKEDCECPVSSGSPMFQQQQQQQHSSGGTMWRCCLDAAAWSFTDVCAAQQLRWQLD